MTLSLPNRNHPRDFVGLEADCGGLANTGQEGHDIEFAHDGLNPHPCHRIARCKFDDDEATPGSVPFDASAKSSGKPWKVSRPGSSTGQRFSSANSLLEAFRMPTSRRAQIALAVTTE